MPGEIFKKNMMWLGGAILLVAATLGLMAVAGQFSGIRLSGGGPAIGRITRGERKEVIIKAASELRSLEICSRRRLPQMDEIPEDTCHMLRNYVAPAAQAVPVVIPAEFPKGEAEVIVRLRGREGELPASQEAFEIIPVWVN